MSDKHTFYCIEASARAIFDDLNDETSLIKVTQDESDAREYIMMPPTLEGQNIYKVTVEKIAGTPSVL